MFSSLNKLNDFKIFRAPNSEATTTPELIFLFTFLVHLAEETKYGFLNHRRATGNHLPVLFEWVKNYFVHLIFICCWKSLCSSCSKKFHIERAGLPPSQLHFLWHLSSTLKSPSTWQNFSKSHSYGIAETGEKGGWGTRKEEKTRNVDFFSHIFHVYTDMKKFCPQERIMWAKNANCPGLFRRDGTRSLCYCCIMSSNSSDKILLIWKATFSSGYAGGSKVCKLRNLGSIWVSESQTRTHQSNTGVSGKENFHNKNLASNQRFIEYQNGAFQFS